MTTTPPIPSGGAPAARSGFGGGWKTSKPPYPYAMRAAHVQGSGSIRISTDSAGHIKATSVIQSTGSTLLDDNTCRYARNYWSGPPDATTVVPITYQLP